MREAVEIVALRVCPVACKVACPSCRRKADNALAALTASGFAVVPVEPTEAMYRAAEDANPFAFIHNPWTRIDEIWKPMLAAANKEPNDDE